LVLVISKASKELVFFIKEPKKEPAFLCPVLLLSQRKHGREP
jgi:hypothetical protein